MIPRPIRPSISNRMGLLAISLLLLSGQTQAEAVGENLMFLDPDGRGYLLQRALRSDVGQRRLHVDKSVELQDFSHIDPNRYEWDDSAAEVNTLSFAQGDVVVIYPGRFPDTQVQAQDDGRFVTWHEPGDFDRFVHAWILPPNLELLGYDSNRQGKWVRRNNALSFFAEQVNNLTFRIRFRQRDSDGDGVFDHLDRCAATPAGTGVDAQGCPLDEDGDGVIDAFDRCPHTDPSARVNPQGCELDSDADGVVDRLDRCTTTAGDTLVDERGCETDLDRDGVSDRRDLCPGTPSGAAVDPAGCEIDCDGDGLVNSLDRCPNTPYGTVVDAHGCPLDQDADGVADDTDLCPQTPAGGLVDALGCEPDSDDDGVLDRLDACPATPAGMAVNTSGCPFDSDLDGVLDSRDLCPNTTHDISVDQTGCIPGRTDSAGGCPLSHQLGRIDPRVRTHPGRRRNYPEAHPGLRLEVAGHTDSVGDDDFNLDVSRSRAEQVRAQLLEHGVQADKLSARGYGEEQPAASNDSALGRAANRRIELRRRGESP